jgi:hypothetical protein
MARIYPKSRPNAMKRAASPFLFLVDPLLNQLPEETQADIINLLALSPSELASTFHRKSLLNAEFDDPSKSML